MKYFVISLFCLFGLASCFIACEKEDSVTVTNTDEKVIDVDPSLFIEAALVKSITKVSCVLSDGTKTTCYEVQTKNTPTDHSMGPWCPTNINDGADKGGKWFEDGKLYDVDGAFVKNLATFYSDSKWKLYNADGSINYTATKEACEAAARPNVDPAYQNFCVQCLPSYIEDDLTLTFYLPVTPVKKSSTSQVGMMNVVGVAFNGVDFDPPAPTSAILGAYTIAPMDDCGGHVNLRTGYHYHAATGCTKRVTQNDGHAAMIGYAMDGYGIYELLDENGNEPTDLDACRGHYDESRGYHYHVYPAGQNAFIGCFQGAQGSFVIN